MSTSKNSAKSRKARIIVLTATLLVVLPLLYATATILFWFSYYETVYHKWNQVELDGVGTVYIPEDWSISKNNENYIDAMIFQLDGKETGANVSGKPLFVCYTLAGYQQAVREQVVFGGLDVPVLKSQAKAQGLWNGVSLYKLEYVDNDTGTKTRLYKVVVHRGNGYVMLSIEDSLKLSTVLKIVYSFHAFSQSEL